MSCAMAASLWAFMRLVERGRIGDYLLFGGAVGLVLISKYGFAAFLIILVACALLQTTMRARLLHVRILAAVCIAAAIIAPFG
jgi:4-amino-4-deoxy-L-arabinose transferase-like glycosyltransferase